MGNTATPAPHPENIILKRTQKSYHNLYSPRDPHKDFLWKKWKFSCIDKAQEQLRCLQAKMSKPVKGVISVLDVEFTKTDRNVYKVRAKVEFSASTLKTFVQERKRTGRALALEEIWDLATQLCEIAVFASQNQHQLPQTLDGYFLFSTKLKIKDNGLLPQVKLQNSQAQPQIRQIISRVVANLALLSLQAGPVPISDINRINLKYNVNLATFVYCLQEEQISVAQVYRLCGNLRDESKDLVYKSATIGHGKGMDQSHLPSKICFPLKQKLQNIKIGGKCIRKSTSEHILNTNVTVTPTAIHAKRIQQIRPKNIVGINLSIQKDPHLKVQQQNKENKGRNANQEIPSTKSFKNSLDIQNHCFPKKLKQFKRVSTTIDDLYESKNPDSKNSSARNEAFIKMTNGSKCQLFAQDENDQLLESIIESEQSIIIKDNESPLLSLDQEMDQIAQDFLKLEISFNSNSNQKEEVKSVMEFVCQRNSTIMEVTEQNEDSGNTDHIRISRIKNSPSDVSKFQIDENVENGQQKFVIEQYEGGSRYEGYVVNGLRNGFGKLYYEDGGSYQGSWKNGEIEGFGKLYYQSGDLAYEGHWLQGEFHGEGKIINEKPDQIIGSFNFTDFSEVGTAWVWYEGNFEHDHKNGAGTLMLSNGQSLTGTWNKNNVEGQGVFVTLSKAKVVGKWANNLLEQIYQQEISECDNLQLF